MSRTVVVSQTRHWVSSFIVAHNICPFARKELDAERILFEVYEGPKMAGALNYLVELFQAMDADVEIETTLLIFPNAFSDFDHYLDLLEVANQLLFDQGYEGMYQLASFHPDYCFEGVEVSDASHYTNRSPYPMLHVIREESLEDVLERYPNPEAIPERNIDYCRDLGVKKLKAIVAECRKEADGTSDS